MGATSGRHCTRRVRRPGSSSQQCGGSEAIRGMPTDELAKLALPFREAGRALGEKGKFPPELVARMAEPRTFGLVARTVVRLLGATGVINNHWNADLKKNGAFARRFDAPYGPRA
jgi:hypothetical protein